jgi:ABC-2 type transport system permease protein
VITSAALPVTNGVRRASAAVAPSAGALLLFGCAINTDPRQRPTAVVAHDSGPFVRGVMQAAATSGCFRITHTVGEAEAEQLLARGEVQFALVFPADFTQRLLRGERPPLVVLAGAS